MPPVGDVLKMSGLERARVSRGEREKVSEGERDVNVRECERKRKKGGGWWSKGRNRAPWE